MQIGLIPYLPAIATTTHQESDFMMEDRLTTLEVTSDSNTAAIAALENEMNDRFNRIETELSELRQNKADNDSTLYRLTNLQDEMNRRFGEVKDEMRRSFSEVKEEAQRRSAELREHIDFTTTISRDENDRRFIDMRRDIEVRFEMMRSAQERDFKKVNDDMIATSLQVNQRFELVDQRFELVDQRFELVDQRFDRVEQRLSDVESSVNDLRKELHIFMRWSIGLHATVLLGLAALIAKSYFG